MAQRRKEIFELASGTLFAQRYRVEGLLGEGGMGAVYRVRDLYLAEPVALKLLPIEATTSPALALRFRQEVKLSRRVSHPNVVRVHDIGEERGFLFLTMELIEGVTLHQVLQSGPMAQERALSIARAIAEALSAAHTVEIIHRDLKPSNILIERGGRVALTDFGIARLLHDELALTQGPIGTPSYMAPEQAAHGAIDCRTDVYALGLILHEMLMGQRPCGSTQQITTALENRAPKLPPALVSLILRCLSRDPEGRPPSAKTVVAHLTSIDEGQDEKTAAAPELLPKAAHSANHDRPALTISAPAPCKLAVLPFRFRGPPAQAYLGDVLADELVDALCRTRGLRVLGSSVTARFNEARDALHIGRELGVGAVIDGVVQAGGDKIRVTVRLIEAHSGVQSWAQVHEGSASDLFAFQESIVRRVSEDLRVELTTLAYAESVPAEAIERYLEARRDLRLGDFQGCRLAVAWLDQALKLAPLFGPALAARSSAAVRAYFYQLEVENREWHDEAEATLAHAREIAADLAETQIALGMFEAQRGAYAASRTALLRALEIAPHCAPAHGYLGMLQIEAGRVDEGLSHLALAAEIDPTNALCLGSIARIHALRGDQAAFEEAIKKLIRAETPDRRIGSVSLKLRAAVWRSDREAIAEVLTEAASLPPNLHSQIVHGYAELALGQGDFEATEQLFTKTIAQARSGRLLSLTSQIAAEACAVAGRHDLALNHITRGVDSVLIDIVWLERCPVLLPLHERPEMNELRRRVRARANTFWE